MSLSSKPTGTEANNWRLKTPGNAGWKRSARPDAKNKYLMVSCDAHVNEPSAFVDLLPQSVKDMLPRMEVDEDGVKWDVVPGVRRIRAITENHLGDEEDEERIASARDTDQIVTDMDRDGVDIQITFPNKGMFMFGLPDEDGKYTMARCYNDWQADYYKDKKDRILPMAVILTQNIDRALEELDRVSKMNFFRGVMVPAKPIYGPAQLSHPTYNQFTFDPLWARIQELNIPVITHVGTGGDTRAFSGPGAAISCRAAIAHPQILDFVSHMCASVIERFPKLRFATIESGVSYLPWLLELMDETHKKHHLWIRHKLKNLPSDYYWENGFASFEEDQAGMNVIDPRLGDDNHYRRLENNFMWANDSPHHEGSWPHSAQAIERQMKYLTDEQRAKILGDNAVRCFNIEDLASKRRVKYSAAAE